MAKIHEEVIVVRFSTLVKNENDSNNKPLISEDLISAIEQVAEELSEKGVVVEIETP